MNKFLSAKSLPGSATAIGIIRVITGALVTYHGLELFDQSIIDKYLSWEKIQKLPAPVFMVYLGKIMELFAGLGLVFGFLTRAASLSLTVVMLFICFYVGKGIFYYDDQHPFLFALMGMLFFYNGPGKWSLDKLFFKSEMNEK